MTGKYLLLALLATAAFAQDPVSITPYQLLDARSGQAVACSGCSIYTYAAGTNTPLATYTSSTLATPNTNPVLTNSAGYAVNGATVTGIWVGSSCYKFVAKDSSAVTIFTQDNICDRGAVLKALLAASGGSALVGYAYPSGITRTVASRLNDVMPSSDFSTFALGCAGSIGTTKTLLVTEAYISLATQTCAGASIQFTKGGSIKPASGQTITLPQDTTCPKSQQCYDESAGGTIAFIGPTSFTPANWGGDPASSANSTTAALACIRSAASVGGSCEFNGVYKIHNLTYTVALTDRAFSITGCGNGCGFTDTTKDGADSLTIDYTNAARPRISITDLHYTGPDATHAGAGSGHGIVINSSNDSQAPWVYIRGLYGIHYYGAGKSPFKCRICEDSQFDWSEFSDSDMGFYGDVSFNGNVLNNIRSHTTYTEGLYCPSCQSNTFNSLLSESTVGRGIYISGAANTLNSPHAEANNTGATGGLCTVEFHASISSGSAGATVGNTINAPIFQGTNEKLCFTNDGTSVSIANVVVGGVSSGLVGGIYLDAYSGAQTFIQYTTRAQVTGVTAETRFVSEQSTGIDYVASGSVATPGIAFSEAPTSGIAYVGGNIAFPVSGLSNLGASQYTAVATAVRFFRPDTGGVPTYATTIARTGACGTAGAPEGTAIYVSDGNGATVGSTLSAGGGIYHEHATCNGSNNWIVTAIL